MIQRKVPLRKCLGCQESFPKKELCRIVRCKSEDDKDTVKFDMTGKLNGRGAYICKKSQCFEKAVKAKRLTRALETDIPTELYEEISSEIAKYE